MCRLNCSGEARYAPSSQERSRHAEQDLVREYGRRKLHRPATTVKTAVVWLLTAEALGIAIAFLAGSVFEELESFCRIPFRPSAGQFYYFGSLIACAVCARKLLITVVELYQHYAPEKLRRKCTLMPSCSEYAILALHKYSVIKGLYKIYVRLTRTCREGGYRIDYP
jgi:putative component of membrane protein insertase Oxa1/YidC/SpoIIIJ protein YidD